MKISISGVLCVASILLCGNAIADGATLFDKTNFSKGQLALGAEETKFAANLKSQKHLLNQTLISVNLTALQSGLITVMTFDGKQLQFVGARREGNARDPTAGWTGKSSSGSPDYFVAGFDSEGLSAQFSDGAKTYQITSLPGGRLHVLSEVLRQPLVEPTPPPWKSRIPVSKDGDQK